MEKTTQPQSPLANGGPAELYQFNSGKVAAPPGHFADTAYIGSQDSNLYALNIGTGRLSWRYTAGSPIARSSSGPAKPTPNSELKARP